MVPALVALESFAFEGFAFDLFGPKLFFSDGGQLHHFALDVVAMEVGLVVLLVGLEVGEGLRASGALELVVIGGMHFHFTNEK